MRRSPLRAKPPPDRTGEPGYKQWHAPIWGKCAACDWTGRLERHHVITEQMVRREGGDPHDLRNSMALGFHCRCHRNHTTAAQRLPASALSAANLAFAVQLLGEDRTADYILRYYAAA